MSDPPLILRPEPFGGIIFDSFDGTMLELDHEGWAVAQKVLGKHPLLLRRAERLFARELKAKLHYNRHRAVRLVRATAPTATQTALPTLAAPTLADFQITEKCLMNCPHCYAAASAEGSHVAWEDIQLVMEQLQQLGICQLAIGGGEPLLHPQIIDLLKLSHELGIVPNMTTGGLELDDEKLRAMKKYCGAVGLSLEAVDEGYQKWRGVPFARFCNSLEQLRRYEIPTVIQIALSAETFANLDAIIDFCASQSHLYGVIFLAYKAVGRGEQHSAPLTSLPHAEVAAALQRAFTRLSPQMRVGYDCCLSPAIAGIEEAMVASEGSNLEGCSAMRGSIGIASNLDVLPCTFTTQLPMGNLRQQRLDKIWRGTAAEGFRQKILTKVASNSSCRDCPKGQNCYGGCPVMELVECHRAHLNSLTETP